MWNMNWKRQIHRLKVQRRMEQAYQQQLINVQNRPITTMERHYLKKGVKRFGVGSGNEF